MNKITILTGFVAGIIGAAIVLGAYIGFNNGKSDKTAYVLTQQMFESFDGTKEMKKKLVKTEEQQKIFFDSLALEIRLLEKKLGENHSQVLERKNEYNNAYTEMNRKYQADVQKYNDGIWQQLNQYVGEYGKANGYTFIYGATGNGNLMFASEHKNMTPELIDYVNKKYAE